MRPTELINPFIVILTHEIVGFVCILIMNIHTNIRIGIIIISTANALAPAGVHFEITILAHIISLEIVNIFTLGSMKYAIFVNNNKTIAEEKNIYNYTIYIAV
jgi:hypothetical protein